MMKKPALLLLFIYIFCIASFCQNHSFNGIYKGTNLQRVAFPIGGIGAGMFCLEGTGALSHFSIRNKPDMFNEPRLFAAITIKNRPGNARVLEGPVPDWKKFGQPDAAIGDPGRTWGLARFKDASFVVGFPFAEVYLQDKKLALAVKITGWSPFIPTDADNSSLPVGGLEYHFKNTGKETLTYIFSYNSRNIMAIDGAKGANSIRPLEKGFILSQAGTDSLPEQQGDFAIFTDDPAVVVNHCWFRSGWFDPLTHTWEDIEDGVIRNSSPQPDARGASIQVPFTLKPGEEKDIRVMMAWYVPNTSLRIGADPKSPSDSTVRDESKDLPSMYHKPWYSSRYKSIEDIAVYWREHYVSLRKTSVLFPRCLLQ